jgi:hypothetical protein
MQDCRELDLFNGETILKDGINSLETTKYKNKDYLMELDEELE